jgi:[acyl-carrier-protein] S-malonyltransferase
MVAGGLGDAGTTEVVHLFPGYGDFALGPLVRALRARRVLRDAVTGVFAAIDGIGVGYGIPPLGPALLGERGISSRDLVVRSGAVQLAQFGAQLAVHRALAGSGRAPDRLVGVGLGEVTAMTAAGVFGLRDGARIVCELARRLPWRTGAAALLGAGERDAHALLDSAADPRLTLLGVNDPYETVVGGPEDALETLRRLAGERALYFARLRTPVVTSYQVARAERVAEITAALRALPALPARLPVHSAALGGPYPADADWHRAAAGCLLRTTRLPEVLRAAVRPPAVLLETGTGSALSRNVRRTLRGSAVPVRAPLAEPGFRWARAEACGAAC